MYGTGSFLLITGIGFCLIFKVLKEAKNVKVPKQINEHVEMIRSKEIKESPSIKTTNRSIFTTSVRKHYSVKMASDSVAHGLLKSQEM